MPYFITVLALIVVGVGFTLLQPKPEVALDANDTSSSEKMNDVFDAPIADNTSVMTQDSEEAPTDTTARELVEQSPQPNSPTSIPSPTPAPAVVNNYKNGTYSTQTNYRTPGGNYQITVGLTVKDDKVTATNISFDSEGALSNYSTRFSSAYQGQVIGQELGNINLSRVGGASLTTGAFNKALMTIKADAKS